MNFFALFVLQISISSHNFITSNLMSTSENDSKANEPANEDQQCEKCHEIRDAFIRRMYGDWNMRQGMCPDCFREQLDKMIETVLGKLPDDTHQWVVSEILNHCPSGEEKSIKDRLDLLATELDEDLVGQDSPCIKCGQNIGCMSDMCPDCWQDHQDARNGVEESDEDQEEVQAEIQEAQIEDDGSCIDCGQNLNFMERRCPDCDEAYRDAL